MSHLIENRLRDATSDAKQQQAILDVTGWDVSMLSKVRSGQAGITIEKIDAVFKALGLVVTSAEFLDYLARGNVIGSNCHCARMNMGECGRP